MTQITEATPTQRQIHTEHIERMRRLGMMPKEVQKEPEKPSNVIELVPPVVDHARELMDFIVAAVGNVAGLPVNEIIAGPPTQEVISARNLALGLCVIRGKRPVNDVAEHFEVLQGSVRRACMDLSPILEANSISHKTPLELVLPLIWKGWSDRASAKRYPSINEIQEAVCKVWGITRGDLISHRRTERVLIPRQVAIAIAKHLTIKSLPEIGRRFDGRDHTTILHSVRKMRPTVDAVAARMSPLANPLEWAMAMEEELQVRKPAPGKPKFAAAT